VVKHIVEKLAKVLSKPADSIRFVLNEVPVDETKTCNGANFANDGVVYFVYKEGNGWEAVQIPVVEI